LVKFHSDRPPNFGLVSLLVRNAYNGAWSRPVRR
jgi:hypothetical protein